MTDVEDYHTCHFCGDDVSKRGYGYDGTRHYLSDCRPDLVEHEIGEICTWAYRLTEYNRDTKEPYRKNETCYAYQDSDLKWTDDHIHFYPDGPM